MNTQLEYDESRKSKHSPARGLLVGLLVIAVVVGLGFYTGLLRLDLSALNKLNSVYATPFSDDPKAITAASNSVVMLNCYDKDGELYATGSGFAMFEEGVIVTNYHVIEQDAYRITADTEAGSSFEIEKVLAFDEKRDIAILKTDAGADELEPLSYGESEALLKGDNVVAIGSPLGIINSVSKGVYSGVLKENGSSFLQFTASISSGSSGGALFNDKGEVVGITSASYTEGQNLNLAIPIDKVVSIWELNDESDVLELVEFYELFEHIQPVYSVEEVKATKESLQGKDITLNGYISYVFTATSYEGADRYFGIVSNENDVLGTSATFGDSSLYFFQASIFKRRPPDIHGLASDQEFFVVSIPVIMDSSFDGIMSDKEYEEYFSPGRWITVKGTFYGDMLRDSVVITE